MSRTLVLTMLGLVALTGAAAAAPLVDAPADLPADADEPDRPAVPGPLGPPETVEPEPRRPLTKEKLCYGELITEPPDLPGPVPSPCENHGPFDEDPRPADDASPTSWIDASPAEQTVRETTTGARNRLAQSSDLQTEAKAGPQAVPRTPDLPETWSLLLAASLALGLVPAWLLYRRIADDEVLDHPTRKRLIERLRDDPGATAADLARADDADYDTVRYHLRLLEDYDEVTTRRLDGKIRYFVNHGTHGRREATVLSALASTVRRGIASAILDEDGLYAGEVAERAGIARSTASHHLAKLTEAGVVERERHGNHVKYRIAPGVRDVVREATG